MIRYSMLTVFLFTLSTAFPQKVYDLEYCIQTGLERNFNLKVVKNNEAISLNNYTPGNAGMLPEVIATNRFGGTLNSTIQNYEDGTVAAGGYLHNTTGSAAVNMGMTIFKGFQVQKTYRRLEKQTELEGFRTQMAIEKLVSEISSEYYNYIQQIALYANLEYAVMLSRERARIDEQRYLLGSGSKMQLLQSQVYLNADSSRYAKQSEILRSSQIRLNMLMATEDIGVEFTIKDSIIQINDQLTYEQLLENTLSNNTSLLIASKNQDITELDFEIIASESYPYLNLSSGYGYNYNTYQTGLISNQHMHGLNYGLTLGLDIFDGFNRRREKSNARIEIESRRIRYQEVEQSIKGNLINIYFAYQNNLRLIRLEEQNLEVARENLEIAVEQYKLGSLAGLELREVQKSLLDAEERLISIKYLTKIAEISLLQISGRVMEYM